MSAVQLLRDLANQIEAGYLIEGRTLVPILARDVKIGDRITDCVGEFVTVEEIEPSGKFKSDGVTPLLRINGLRTQPGFADGFQSGVSAWGDEWVVVER